MRTTALVFALGLSAGAAAAADATTDLNPVRELRDGLHAMDYAGSNAKSTVVEFDGYLVLIEVPVRDEGGGARVLTDDVAGGEKVLRTLRARFPEKPLKYVLASHWHPHSISSVKPFLDAGVTLVMTPSNFERLRPAVDAPTLARAAAQIRLVDGDTLTIGTPPDAIVAHRFTRKDYPACPTEDYLYFHLPRQDVVHCGCMYNKWEGAPVAGRELLTAREEDLYRFLAARGLKTGGLLRLNKEKNAPGEVLPFAGLEQVVKTGISSKELADRYRALATADLRARRAELVRDAARDGIPPRIFNDLAYEHLRRGDLPKALEFATLQALLNPGDRNAWDTLGEAHYFLGDEAAWRLYERQARALDPQATDGGEAAWKKDLEDYRKAWSAAP